MGLLIVRAWVEADSGRGLRARITQTLDLETREESVTLASSVDEVVAAVRVWLDALLERAGRAGDDTVTDR